MKPTSLPYWIGNSICRSRQWIPTLDSGEFAQNWLTWLRSSFLPLVRSSCTLNLAVARMEAAATLISEVHSLQSAHSTTDTLNYYNCMGHGSYLTLESLYDVNMFIKVVFTNSCSNSFQVISLSRRTTSPDNNLSLSTKKSHHNIYSFTMYDLKIPYVTKRPNRSPKRLG